jgi:hypothetical protein
MGVERLVAPRWGGGATEEVIERPTWVEVAARVRRLDGDEFNDLYLERLDEGKWLAVGGGDIGYFVMLTFEAQTDSECGWVAEYEAGGDDEKELVVGGQPCLFPSRQVVSLPIALDAVRIFHESGGAADTVAWNRDP